MSRTNDRGQSILRLEGGADAEAFAGALWCLRAGEHWVISGANGSGKSWLASFLSGEAIIRGLTLELAEEYEEWVALVTFSQQQEQASESWLQARWHAPEDTDVFKVQDFLSYERVNEINPFEIRPAEVAARESFRLYQRELIEVFELESIWKSLILQLSNGEMRRVLLARALLNRPRLLILDDPFAGLDGMMRQQLFELMEHLADVGITLILSVRHEDEVPSCMTHCMELENCRIKSVRRLAGEMRSVAGAAEPVMNGYEPMQEQSGEVVVEIRDLSISYGERTIFRNLDWRVCAGERWLVSGANGSGKTTLLSLITGDNPRAYGYDIRVFGQQRRSGANLWEIRHRIAQVSPELQCHFEPSMTVLEAAQSGRYSGSGEVRRATPASRAAARRWLAALEVDVPGSQLFGTLSAGQQRLVLLVRAMVAEPELLLLDEPCLNLDRTGRGVVLRALGRVAKEEHGQTIICVAHRADEVPEGMTHRLCLGGEVFYPRIFSN